MDTRIAVVLFDIGGVVIPPADPVPMGRVAGRLGLSGPELAALFYEWEPWYALSTGRLDEDGYWRALGERVGWEAAALRRLAGPVWDAMAVDSSVVDLVRALDGSVRVAALSNATLRLEENLRRLGVAQYFDPIVNSARVGLRKPDPRVFAHTLDVLGVPAQAILLVDDKRRNTAVAEEMGYRTVLFDRAATLAAALGALALLPPRTPI